NELLASVSAPAIERHALAPGQSLGDEPRVAGRWPVHPRLLIVGLLLVAAGLGVLELRWLALGSGLWLSGLVLVAAGTWGPAADTGPPTASQRASGSVARWELATVGAILGVGLLLRVWAPEQYP